MAGRDGWGHLDTAALMDLERLLQDEAADLKRDCDEQPLTPVAHSRKVARIDRIQKNLRGIDRELGRRT